MAYVDTKCPCRYYCHWSNINRCYSKSVRSVDIRAPVSNFQSAWRNKVPVAAFEWTDADPDWKKVYLSLINHYYSFITSVCMQQIYKHMRNITTHFQTVIPRLTSPIHIPGHVTTSPAHIPIQNSSDLPTSLTAPLIEPAYLSSAGSEGYQMGADCYQMGANDCQMGTVIISGGGWWWRRSIRHAIVSHCDVTDMPSWRHWGIESRVS